MNEPLLEEENPLAHLPQHVQDAFATGGSVRIGQVMCLTAEEYEVETAKERDAEASQGISAVAAPLSLFPTTNDAELKAEKEAHEATKSELEKAQSAASDQKTKLDALSNAVNVSSKLLQQLIPKKTEELAKLTVKQRAAIAAAYEVKTEGLNEAGILDALSTAVHG